MGDGDLIAVGEIAVIALVVGVIFTLGVGVVVIAIVGVVVVFVGVIDMVEVGLGEGEIVNVGEMVGNTVGLGEAVGVGRVGVKGLAEEEAEKARLEAFSLTINFLDTVSTLDVLLFFEEAVTM